MIIRKNNTDIYECDCCGYQRISFDASPKIMYVTLGYAGWSLYDGKLYCPKCTAELEKHKQQLREKYFNDLCGSI